MIKDLSAKLVAAVTEINQKSRQSFAAEQQEVATKKAASAKMHTFMPKQPAPKADPAAVLTSKKMAEEAEGTVPKTPREKELAAKHGNKNLITHGDVMKARGVKKEGWNPIKHIPKENQTPAIKAAAKDVKRGSYADRAALLKAGGVKEEVEQQDEEHGGFKKLAAKTSPALAAWIGREKYGKDKFQKMAADGKKQQTEGFKDMMKKIGNKVLDAVAPSDDKLIDNLHKSVHGKNAPNVPKPKPKLKLAHDYVKEEKEKGKKPETAAKEKTEVPEWKKKLNDPYAKEKSAFNSKQISTGTVYSRKYEEVETLDELSKSTLGSYAKKATRDATITRKIGADFEHQSNRAKSPGMKAASNEMSQKYKEKSWKRRDGVDKAVDRLTKEEVESVGVKHEQFGAGKTLPQFAEDLSWIDVMFEEGIKRVDVEDLELTEEKAVHPDAIHVSNAGGGKYKVHAVGKNFSSGIKVGEHLTDTHLDDFSEMGGKIKTVKAPKKD